MAVRKVRTAAGVKRYDQPIGSIIVADSVLKSLKVTGTPYKGWTRVKAKDGKEYDIGNDEDANVWVALKPDTWEILVDEGDTEEEVFELLDKAVGNKNKGLNPKNPITGTAIDKPAPKKTAKKGADSNAQKTTGTAKKPSAAKKTATTPKKVAKKAPAKKASEPKKQTAKKTTPAKETTTRKRNINTPKQRARMKPEDMTMQELRSEELRTYDRMFGSSDTARRAGTRYREVTREINKRKAEGASGDTAKKKTTTAKKSTAARRDTANKPNREQIRQDVEREMSRKPQGMTPGQKLSEEEKRDTDELPFEQRDKYLDERKAGKNHEDAFRAVTGNAPPRKWKQYDKEVADLKKQIATWRNNNPIRANARRGALAYTPKQERELSDLIKRMDDLRKKRGPGKLTSEQAKERSKLGEIDGRTYEGMRSNDFSHYEIMETINRSNAKKQQRNEDIEENNRRLAREMNERLGIKTPEGTRSVSARDLKKGQVIVVPNSRPEQRLKVVSVTKVKDRSSNDDRIEVTYPSDRGGGKRRYRLGDIVYVDEATFNPPKERNTRTAAQRRQARERQARGREALENQRRVNPDQEREDQDDAEYFADFSDQQLANSIDAMQRTIRELGRDFPVLKPSKRMLAQRRNAIESRKEDLRRMVAEQKRRRG